MEVIRRSFDIDGSRVELIFDEGRQALALPTAVPVGEHEAFERTMMDKYGWQRNDFELDDFGYFDGHTDTAWMAWQALSAQAVPDKVDAQRYRWLADCNNYYEAITLISDVSLTADALGKAIDAAMRKESE